MRQQMNDLLQVTRCHTYLQCHRSTSITSHQFSFVWLTILLNASVAAFGDHSFGGLLAGDVAEAPAAHLVVAPNHIAAAARERETQTEGSAHAVAMELVGAPSPTLERRSVRAAEVGDSIVEEPGIVAAIGDVHRSGELREPLESSGIGMVALHHRSAGAS